MLKGNFQLYSLSAILRMFIGIIIFMPSMPLLAEDYNSYIQQGDKYYEQFENQKALEEYKKAYESSPNSFVALMKLTRAYNDVGEDIKGIKFRREDELNSNKKVEEYFKTAAKYAELLQKEFPDKADSYFLLAATYGHLALYKDGREKVRLARDVEKNSKRAIQLDPRYIPAYIVLGVYYREVANLNWALKAFARTLFGGLPHGTDKDSEKTLLKAVQLNPQIIHTRFELAKTYDAMDEGDEVAEQLKEILDLPVVDHQDKAIKTEAEKELRRLAKR
jgi:tetratricopeptide (TPR) repeat protein